MKKALIFQGGTDNVELLKTAARFERILKENDYDVTVTDSPETLNDAEYLKSLDLIVPCWTNGEMPDEYCANVCDAVASGVGIAGCHGGMCDTFRNNIDWHYMTGGQYVASPTKEETNFVVNIRQSTSRIMEGLEDFVVTSKQYYLHVDPAVEVLASVKCPVANGYPNLDRTVDMPVVWTKNWGCGRVFYCSLGYTDDVFYRSPNAQTIMERGMLWAGEGKAYSVDNCMVHKEGF